MYFIPNRACSSYRYDPRGVLRQIPAPGLQGHRHDPAARRPLCGAGTAFRVGQDACPYDLAWLGRRGEAPHRKVHLHPGEVFQGRKDFRFSVGLQIDQREKLRLALARRCPPCLSTLGVGSRNDCAPLSQIRPWVPAPLGQDINGAQIPGLPGGQLWLWSQADRKWLVVRKCQVHSQNTSLDGDGQSQEQTLLLVGGQLAAAA